MTNIAMENHPINGGIYGKKTSINGPSIPWLC